ncbi:MAG: DUF1232 domain-containing protein [Bacteroidaceae bacterium]|nr:DUF1232 domain-containing protein [Bacteroidaceae bacterium]
MTNNTFEEAYSESSFWDKLASSAKKMGRVAVENALKLFYAVTLGKASPAQVSIIIGALGYLIFPADAIPDLIPGGLADDAGVLTAAVGLLACCSDPEVVAAAKVKASEWFD